MLPSVGGSGILDRFEVENTGARISQMIIYKEETAVARFAFLYVFLDIVVGLILVAEDI